MKCYYCGKEGAENYTFAILGGKIIEINRNMCKECKEKYERENSVSSL